MTDYPEAPTQINYPIDETKEEAILRLATLWKTDDPEWLAQRQKEWQQLSCTVYDNYPKSEKKFFERYYIYGEYTKYFSRCVLPLTPYTNSEELMGVFNSRLFDYRNRQFCFTEYVFDSNKFCRMQWYRSQMQLFIDEFLTEGYIKIIEQTSNCHVDEVSVPSSWWCKSYVKEAARAIKDGIAWRPLYECVPYLISALPFSSDSDHHSEIRWNKLWPLVEMNRDNQDLPEELRQFIVQLSARKEEIMQAWELGNQRMLAQGNI